MQQTLYDIEIITVDDGSTDESGKVLDEYAKLDSRIQVIHKPNGGLSSARNAGCRIATGDWIMYLDSDDYLEPMACERVWLETLERPTDIVTFGANIFPTVPKVDRWYEAVLNPYDRRYENFSPEVLFRTTGAMPFVWRQAFSSKLLRENELMFQEDIRFGEDLVYQMQVFPMAKKFAFIHDHLYNYRWCREDSLMGQVQNAPDKRMEQHLLMVEEVTHYWQEKGLLERYAPEYLDWLLNFMVPDLTNPKLQRAQEHAAGLLQIIENYDLERVLPKESSEVKALWRKLKNLC